MATQKHYLVSYDISSDKKRKKVAAELEKYGLRVQYSVFECVFTEKEKKQCSSLLETLIDRKTDSVLFYILCAECTGKKTFVGNNLSYATVRFSVQTD